MNRDMKYEEAKSTRKDSSNLSLNKLMGKNVVDIEGYVSTEFGEPTFKISQVIFDDGTSVWAEGEHDMPYLTCVDEDILDEVRKTDPDYEEEEED